MVFTLICASLDLAHGYSTARFFGVFGTREAAEEVRDEQCTCDEYWIHESAQDERDHTCDFVIEPACGETESRAASPQTGYEHSEYYREMIQKKEREAAVRISEMTARFSAMVDERAYNG